MPLMSSEDLSSGVLKILVYGPTGAGKTFFCGTAYDVSEFEPILYADLEDGILPIRAILRERWTEVQRPLKVVGPEDIRFFVNAMFDRKGPYRTVVIDSLTELHALLMKLRLAEQGRAGQAPFQQDYGDVSATMLRLMRRVKDELQVNLICTAGEEVNTDEFSSTMYLLPDIVGKLCRRVPRYFDVVGHLTAQLRTDNKDGTIKKAVRQLQLQPVNHIWAKCRIPALENVGVLNSPTIRKLHNAHTGHVDQEDILEDDNGKD
ncbi:MAG: AAA family ATPase [Candidatus Altiarchaeales archaeon]|nr:AAA family ATPase [Candidatus Altiarchaeales archaeon]